MLCPVATPNSSQRPDPLLLTLPVSSKCSKGSTVSMSCGTDRSLSSVPRSENTFRIDENPLGGQVLQPMLRFPHARRSLGREQALQLHPCATSSTPLSTTSRCAMCLCIRLGCNRCREKRFHLPKLRQRQPLILAAPAQYPLASEAGGAAAPRASSCSHMPDVD